MSASTYQTNSLSWQVRQAAQRLNQGVEYWFSQLEVDPPELPNWTWPETLGRGLFWVLVVALALWFSWLLYRGIKGYWQRRQPAASLKTVPAAETHSSSYWWQQAQAQAQAGRYADACRCLYLAALQRLDDTQILLQDASRTDGEYLLGLERQAALQQSSPGAGLHPSQPYQLLIRTHERILFGDAAITAEIFQRCRRAYQEIQK